MDKLSRIIEEAARLVRSQGGDLIVLFIPTKYHVYQDLVKLDSSYVEQVRMNIGEELQRRLTAKGLGMRYVDVTRALRQAATDGRIVYFPDDTHWTEEGHRVAAQVVHENLGNAAETKKQHSLNDTRTP